MLLRPGSALIAMATTGVFSQLLISANIVQYQQSPALGMPCFGGGDLLLGRFGYKPKLELRLKLGRDFGNRTLAAKLKHYRIERTLYQSTPLTSGDNGTTGGQFARLQG
jgi:hypothetical protein